MPYFKPFPVADENAPKRFGGRAQTVVRRCTRTEKFHRVESFYGSFERSFSLPENVNVDTIRCDSKDGVLSVHIPKVETPKHKPKQITVQ
jgi:HSP20 family molecular chaperone IbpA